MTARHPVRPTLRGGAADRALLASLVDPAWLVDARGLCVREANAAAVRWLGGTEAELVGRPASALLPLVEDLAFWHDVADGVGHSLESEVELSLPDGRLVYTLRRIVAVPASDGKATDSYLVTLQDLSRQRQAERESDILLAELRATLEATADGILVTDLSGHIRAFNRRFAALWSLPESALTERDDQRVHDWMLLNVSQPEAYDRRLQAIHEQMLVAATDTLNLVDGTVLERHTQPQWSHGRPIGRVYSFREINRRRPGAPRRERSDTLDDWTQLPLRSTFVTRLESSVGAARAGGAVFSVLCIEYDREALFGCGKNDVSNARTMADLTEGLRATLRTPHLMARLGGARFGILVEGAGEAAAEAMARRLLQQSRLATAGALATDGLAAVVGIASYPQAGMSADDLLNHAELAMAQARRSGGGYLVHRFTLPTDSQRAQRLEHDLRGGLSHPAFRIQYLPRLDAHTGRVQAMEALVRWHDGHGELLPAQFMPLAEKAGLAGALDDWVMEQALRHALQWRRQGLDMRLTLNVGGWQLTQPNFVRRLEAVLGHVGWPAAQLEVDVTESALATDPDSALPALRALRQLGVGVVLDDFGAGLASLSMLRHYPFTGVKIDRSMVRDLSRSAHDRAIVAGLIRVVRSLDMAVSAEGVEDETQRQFVVEQGCQGWQGLLCAPPMEPRRVAQWVRDTEAAAMPGHEALAGH
jgi:diguanylate cyclase (GGDEF)-like protein